jgi:hypothetical protein
MKFLSITNSATNLLVETVPAPVAVDVAAAGDVDDDDDAIDKNSMVEKIGDNVNEKVDSDSTTLNTRIVWFCTSCNNCSHQHSVPSATRVKGIRTLIVDSIPFPPSSLTSPNATVNDPLLEGIKEFMKQRNNQLPLPLSSSALSPAVNYLREA